jgi:Kef-type K+ transport system membrane component KefB
LRLLSCWSPNTVGPIIYARQTELLAELGIVFLLFTIGLNDSVPQLNAAWRPAWRWSWT